MNKLTVGAIQMQSRDDKAYNLSRTEALIDAATYRSAKLVALPELFSFCGSPQLQKENAEPIPGPTTEILSGMARERHIYILGGSLVERVNEMEKVFNTSVLIDPVGKIIAKYRKIHLFDITLGKQVVVQESETVEHGDELVTVETEYCTVGMTICYDLRFPELYRGLTQKGSKIIFIPSSFMASTGKDHWEPLIRARAIENQIFIVAPNEIGPIPGTNILRHGRSMIVDPWGTVLAQASDIEGVIIAELDLDYLLKVRAELPSLTHRQPGIYGRS